MPAIHPIQQTPAINGRQLCFCGVCRPRVRFCRPAFGRIRQRRSVAPALAQYLSSRAGRDMFSPAHRQKAFPLLGDTFGYVTARVIYILYALYFVFFSLLPLLDLGASSIRLSTPRPTYVFTPFFFERVYSRKI
ncbi:MAG: hypothetical protein ACLRSW_05390 [Christensenellaceae bacterium]